MYLNRKAITLEEAQALLDSIDIQTKIVEISVNEALGYVLAADIYAPFPIPAFRRSGYDGYGILSEDDHSFPREFEVVDNIGAGSLAQDKLLSGQTVRIMTGAKVPDEVGKIIMLEVTETLPKDRVLIKETMKHSNISQIGEEFSQGALLLKAGTRLNSGSISLLNAFGYAKTEVYARPKVAVIATGSELMNAGDEYTEGKIYNSNGPLLSGLVKENGGEVVSFKSVRDNENETFELLSEMTKQCDLIITTGGVSVGDFDFMATAAKASSKFLFNKLAMRPGSPTTAFVLNNTPIIALSGNPGACFTGFYLFAEPVIQRFQGLVSRVTKIKASIDHDYKKVNNFDKFVRATLQNGKISQVGSDKSSALGNLHLTTAFFRVPHDTELNAGDAVETWLLPHAIQGEIS